jgi:hypothetical protein
MMDAVIHSSHIHTVLNLLCQGGGGSRCFRRYKLKLRVEPCGVFFCTHIGKKVNAKQHVYWPYAQIKKWLCSFHCGGRCGFDLIIHMGCHDRPMGPLYFFYFCE